MNPDTVEEISSKITYSSSNLPGTEFTKVYCTGGPPIIGTAGNSSLEEDTLAENKKLQEQIIEYEAQIRQLKTTANELLDIIKNLVK